MFFDDDGPLGLGDFAFMEFMAMDEFEEDLDRASSRGYSLDEKDVAMLLDKHDLTYSQLPSRLKRKIDRL